MKGRARVVLIGGVGGLVIGLVGAWLYLRSAQEDDGTELELPRPADLARLGFSIAVVLRQIRALGRPGRD
jgi:hypothetical protein